MYKNKKASVKALIDATSNGLAKVTLKIKSIERLSHKKYYVEYIIINTLNNNTNLPEVFTGKIYKDNSFWAYTAIKQALGNRSLVNKYIIANIRISYSKNGRITINVINQATDSNLQHTALINPRHKAYDNISKQMKGNNNASKQLTNKDQKHRNIADLDSQNGKFLRKDIFIIYNSEIGYTGRKAVAL